MGEPVRMPDFDQIPVGILNVTPRGPRAQIKQAQILRIIRTVQCRVKLVYSTVGLISKQIIKTLKTVIGSMIILFPGPIIIMLFII